MLGSGLRARLSFLDLAQGVLLGAGQALGVDAEQHRDAIARPFGYASRLDPGIQPG
jgi:hypothetical protein